MSFFETVGTNILSILDEKQMTQKELADSIGVSKQVMTKIVKGSKAINALEIKNIANALNISVDRLIEENVRIDETSDYMPVFKFMGKIRNEKTKEKFELLNSVIYEIMKMEEVLNEKV